MDTQAESEKDREAGTNPALTDSRKEHLWAQVNERVDGSVEVL